MQSTTSVQERGLWRSFFVMRRPRAVTLERRLGADAGIPSVDFRTIDTIHPTTCQEEKQNA